MFYSLAHAFLTVAMTWGAIRLLDYVRHEDAQCVAETQSRLITPDIDIRIRVRTKYIAYKASGGVLDAYHAGLAFGVALELYDAQEACLACLRRNQRELPTDVRQSVLEELRWKGNK